MTILRPRNLYKHEDIAVEIIVAKNFFEKIRKKAKTNTEKIMTKFKKKKQRKIKFISTKEHKGDRRGGKMKGFGLGQGKGRSVTGGGQNRDGVCVCVCGGGKRFERIAECFV